jgi:hypothetical protein
MDREISSTTQYKPVTVDVPEDRVAEFHAFFARFLAGPTGRGRGGRHGGHHHGRHGHGHGRGSRCGARHETAEQGEPTAAPTEL